MGVGEQQKRRIHWFSFIVGGLILSTPALLAAVVYFTGSREPSRIAADLSACGRNYYHSIDLEALNQSIAAQSEALASNKTDLFWSLWLSSERRRKEFLIACMRPRGWLLRPEARCGRFDKKNQADRVTCYFSNKSAGDDSAK
jgi:hypothetical protein